MTEGNTVVSDFHFRALAASNQNLLYTVLDQSGSSFHVGTTTVNCTATDASGNQGTCSFSVTVTDTIKPQITCPGDMTNSCTGPNGATVTFSATATDNCDPNPVVNCTPGSGTVFHQGATTVHCTAEDASGNQANCSFTVTVEDNTSATLTIVQNGTQVTISYPSTCTTYRLVHKSNLDDPTWDNVSGVQLMGDHYEASYTTTGGSGFFQLQSP